MTDEDLNNDKLTLTVFLKKNRIKIISLAIIILMILFSFIFINEYKNKKNVEISKNFNKAQIFIEKNKTTEAVEILIGIINEKNNFYSPSALNLVIDNNLVKNKKEILGYFDKILSISSLDPETKNLFIFKKVIFIGDEITENELLNNLKPLIRSNSLWKSTVSDYIKKYYLSKGEFLKAKEFTNSKM